MIQFEGIDLFCGAGGTTTGIHAARLPSPTGEGPRMRFAKVLACVNHDRFAIASHAANHPSCRHYIEDIRTIDVHKLPRNEYKADTIFFLWASLECTNFSNAKGGKPRDGDSRSLADHMDDYVLYMQPDFFSVENVREFMAWGPLDKNGKPISRDKGADYLKWVERIKSYGYHYDFRLINSADHGAYTSRLRYFGIFVKWGVNVSYPLPTHAKNPEKQSGLFGRPLLKWNAVKHVLDLEDEGKSIFGRKKQHSEKSLERVYAGCIRFIAGGKENFLAKMDQTGSNGSNVIDTDRPANTITTADAHKIVSVKKAFIAQRNTGDPNNKITSINDPARTITSTGGNQDIVQAQFLIQYNGNVPKQEPRTNDIEQPITAIATSNRHALVKPQYLASYYGNGENVGSTESPAGTITTKDRIALVTAEHYLMNNYTGVGQTNDIEGPAPAVLSSPKSNLVSAKFMVNHYGNSKASDIKEPAGTITANPKSDLVNAFILNSNFNNEASGIDEPAKTIVASRKHKYLVNPQWFNSSAGSIDNPACTLIARMDKAPLSIVTTEYGEAIAVVIYEDDTPMMKKIKEFMALYGIVDIKIRMLKIPELLRIQGFPDGYVLIGTQTEQKKYIGNAVVSLVMKRWFESLYEANKYFERVEIKNKQA